jgi:hypothetical protein
MRRLTKNMQRDGISDWSFLCGQVFLDCFLDESIREFLAEQLFHQVPWEDQEKNSGFFVEPAVFSQECAQDIPGPSPFFSDFISELKPQFPISSDGNNVFHEYCNTRTGI